MPWDWTDVRLNSFALLTLLALLLVLGRRAQPDGVESRDTFATAGLFGFVLVPLTYIATRIWRSATRVQSSHRVTAGVRWRQKWALCLASQRSPSPSSSSATSWKAFI